MPGLENHVIHCLFTIEKIEIALLRATKSKYVRIIHQYRLLSQLSVRLSYIP